MRKILSALILLLNILVLPAQSQYSMCYTYNIKAGDDAFAKGLYEDAKSFYVNASKCSNPNSEEAQQKISACNAKLTGQSGTTIGNSQNTPASCGTVTDYDGNTYSTVKIGYQCWMAQNLRTTHYANGTSIPQGNKDSWRNESASVYYAYTSSRISLEEQGYYYSWPAAMRGAASSNRNPSGIQGVCPSGWHLPSKQECEQLKDYMCNQSRYGCEGKITHNAKALASTRGWKTSNESCTPGFIPSSNNTTGFSATPTGIIEYGSLSNFGIKASYWTSTIDMQLSCLFISTLRVYYTFDTIDIFSSISTFGHPVRCVRN